MGNKLTDAEREKIWYVLSDVFVDSDVDFPYIARNLRSFDMEQIKEIFFREVAPICGVNLMTVIPPIWSGFSEDEVRQDIRGMLKKREDSFIFRVRNDVFVAFCRWYFRSYWKEVEDVLLA
ncbi:DUF7079 family protein [Collimonas silvisoli]|uniref:DUF7079 family protein n=1 Tax=Collimonas silvisoli TaxID=2825884 RepID=UPI001B8AEDB3|nr:hypothetical protein [Collimonas silvisoli]